MFVSWDCVVVEFIRLVLLDCICSLHFIFQVLFGIVNLISSSSNFPF